jgi:hypothetical protein
MNVATRLVGWLPLCLSLIASANLSAQPEQAEPAQTRKDGVPPKAQGDEVLGISLDRVKERLGHDQPLKISPDQPTFHVHVVERRKSLLPDFNETLKVAWEPIPPGGVANYEFTNMVTPPQARLYGAFSGGELLQVAATSIVGALVTSAMYKALEAARLAWQGAAEEEAREQVKRELEEFLRTHPYAPRPVR